METLGVGLKNDGLVEIGVESDGEQVPIGNG